MPNAWVSKIVSESKIAKTGVVTKFIPVFIASAAELKVNLFLLITINEGCVFE